jgi:hypothetical protein
MEDANPLSARQTGRLHRELDRGARELASDGPHLAPASEIPLLKLPGGRPSSCAIGRGDDRTPIGPPIHCRSDAYWLIWQTSNENFEAVADVKVSTGGMARIHQTHKWTLG